MIREHVHLGQPLISAYMHCSLQLLTLFSTAPYLHSFLIGVMDGKPTTHLFPYAYTLCHKHVGGVAKPNQAESYKCRSNARGRYVVIQMPGRMTNMLIREVAVYAFPEDTG